MGVEKDGEEDDAPKSADLFSTLTPFRKTKTQRVRFGSVRSSPVGKTGVKEEQDCEGVDRELVVKLPVGHRNGLYERRRRLSCNSFQHWCEGLSPRRRQILALVDIF